MAVLCAEELVGVVVELAGVAVDYAVLGRYVTYFVVVPCTVYTYIILEVLADVVVPREVEFPTVVLHVAAIDIRCAGAGSAKNRCNDEPVFGRFPIPVEVYVQATAYEACVDTDVGLFRCFPCHVFVAQSVWVCAPVAALCSRAHACTEVVVGVGAFDWGKILIVGDVLVAHLSPAGTQLEEVEPRLDAFHELLVADGPTG